MCGSILNSMVIVLMLSGGVAVIMRRTLRKDITRCNQADDSVRLSHRTLHISLIALLFL